MYAAVPDVPLCLCVLKNRAPLARGRSSCQKAFSTINFRLCGANFNLQAFCFGAIPDIMIELIVYVSLPQSKQSWQWLSGIKTKLLGGLRLFMCLMVTNCSGERYFSRLKRIKNDLSSTMSQERMSGVSILCIENDKLWLTDIGEIIDEFAARKVRRKMFWH